jgi:hypothetical protein
MAVIGHETNPALQHSSQAWRLFPNSESLHGGKQCDDGM